MSHKIGTKLLFALGAGLFATVILVSPFDLGIVRVAAAIPLALLLPGYLLFWAIFPASTYGAVEQLVFSIVGSVTITILGGLSLHGVGLDLVASNWALMLGSMCATLGIVAHMRRGSTPTVAFPSLGLHWGQGVLLGLASLLVVGALAIARTPLPAENVLGYTMLWLVPTPDRASSVNIGIKSVELSVMSYRLELQRGGELVQVWDDLQLNPGQRWEQQITVALTDREDIEVFLYHTDALDVVYRRVKLLGLAQ